MLLGLDLFIQAAAQHLHGFFLVLQLALFILAGNYKAAWHVGDAHGRIGFVDILAAVSAGAVGIDAQVIRVDIHIHLVRLRQDGHGRGAGVDAALRFGAGYTLDAVDTAFKLHAGESAAPCEGEYSFLHAPQFRLIEAHVAHLKAAALGIARVHPQQQGPKQPGFLPAGTRADLHDHVAVVITIPGDQIQLEPIAKLSLPFPQLGQLFLRHISEIRAVRQFLGGGDLLPKLQIAAPVQHRLFKPCAFLHQLLPARQIGDHLIL